MTEPVGQSPEPLRAERLRHLPFERETSGLRFCMVCAEEWPCDVRRGYRDSEHPSPSGDPLGTMYPGQDASDDWR